MKRRALSRRLAASVAAAVLCVSAASPAEAARVGVIDYVDYWVVYNVDSTYTQVEPHLSGLTQAVLARYYSGSVHYFYGQAVNNWITYPITHSVSFVSNTTGTHSGNYFSCPNAFPGLVRI